MVRRSVRVWMKDAVNCANCANCANRANCANAHVARALCCEHHQLVTYHDLVLIHSGSAVVQVECLLLNY